MRRTILLLAGMLILAGTATCSPAWPWIRPSPSPSPGGDACHPGGVAYCALNATVTQATKGTTICAPGWNQSERRRGDSIVHYATLKRKLLDQMHARGEHPDWDLAHVELDHRMAISLGGSVTDLSNLSLEYGDAGHPGDLTHNRKDDAETQLFDAACHHGMDLGKARAQLVRDWLGPFPQYKA